MNRRQLEELAKDLNFIKGIYNYCDRWCERCPFTSRCINFALTAEELTDAEINDPSNDVFWEKIAQTLQTTLDLVREKLETEGIDSDSLDLEASKEESRLKREIAESHKCCRAAKKYADTVEGWFQAMGEPDPEEEGTLPMPEAFPFEEELTYEDAIAVIRWYQHFIYVKLARAVRSKIEEEEEGEPDDYQKDSDGSAKVASVAIDRSIGAWGKMRNHILARQDVVLKFIFHLENLKKTVEETFPEAKAFIRPGFDKIDFNS